MATTTTTKLKYRHVKSKQKPLIEQVKETTKLIWHADSQKGITILGRSPKRFGLCMALYVGMIVAMIIVLTIFNCIFLYLVVDANYPVRIMDDTPLQHNPGMSVRPQPNLETSLIRFVQGDPSSYKVHLDHIQTFIEQYENRFQTGENYIDCQKGKRVDEMNKVCRFDIDTLGEKCTWQQEYGYDEGQPCVVLKLNKIYGWEPLGYESNEIPREVKGVYDRDYLPVTCEGETPVDRENIGNITFFPPQGFPTVYFPYVNQEDYRQPLVMARFENPVNGVVINVWCKVWAKNIYHHRYDMQGSVHFEILID